MNIREFEQDDDVWKRIRTIFSQQSFGRISGGAWGRTRVKYGQPIFCAFLYCAHKVVYLREPITVWAINSEKLKIAWETSHWSLRIGIVYKCNMLQFISKLSTEWLNYIYCIETLTTNVPNFASKFASSLRSLEVHIGFHKPNCKQSPWLVPEVKEANQMRRLQFGLWISSWTVWT
jgi:hypothetical protein